MQMDLKKADELNKKGIGLGMSGKHEEAIKTFEAVLQIYPFFFDAWLNIGISYIQLCKYEEALHACNKAIEMDSQKPFAWSSKGVALTHLNRIGEAVIAFEKALKIDPGNATILKTMDELGFSIKIKDKADEWIDKGVELGESDKLEEAIKAFDKALEIDPKRLKALNNKGITLCILGRFKEAIVVFDKALKIDPNYESALKNKKAALNELNKLK